MKRSEERRYGPMKVANYIQEHFPVKENEKFLVLYYGGTLNAFIKDGILFLLGRPYNATFSEEEFIHRIKIGSIKIREPAFLPKRHQTFYSIRPDGQIVCGSWENSHEDYALYLTGNSFRNPDDITEEIKKEYMDKIHSLMEENEKEREL